jgi:hypothetical protein
VILKKQDKNSMQTEELIGPGGCHGAYRILWCYPLLRWLHDRRIFLSCEKNFTTKLFSTSFLECLILESTKIICVLQRKPQIKFGARCPESVLSCQHSLNIKILKKSSWDSNKCLEQQKTKYANKNSSSLAKFSAPLIQVKDEKLQFR